MSSFLVLIVLYIIPLLNIFHRLTKPDIQKMFFLALAVGL
jgi:hypothetical protein